MAGGGHPYTLFRDSRRLDSGGRGDVGDDGLFEHSCSDNNEGGIEICRFRQSSLTSYLQLKPRKDVMR